MANVAMEVVFDGSSGRGVGDASDGGGATVGGCGSCEFAASGEWSAMAAFATVSFARVCLRLNNQPHRRYKLLLLANCALPLGLNVWSLIARCWTLALNDLWFVVTHRIVFSGVLVTRLLVAHSRLACFGSDDRWLLVYVTALIPKLLNQFIIDGVWSPIDLVFLSHDQCTVKAKTVTN